MPTGGDPAADFDPDQVIDEWRRLYDWAVMTRQSIAFIEEVGFLGQQFSSVLNAYRHPTTQRRRVKLRQELLATFDAMQGLYNRLDDSKRILLRFRHDAS